MKLPITAESYFFFNVFPYITNYLYKDTFLLMLSFVEQPITEQYRVIFIWIHAIWLIWYKFIFTFTNIYIIKRMPLFILAVLPGNWIVHCTFLSSLVYIRLIFVQFSLFLYSSVCKSVWKSHPYENSLIPTLVWILYE